jgi:arabinofuranosyltransferase
VAVPDTVGGVPPATGRSRPRSIEAQARAPRIPPALDWVLVAAVWLGFARWNYFFQDDAYISLRYARNLARGHGLVWSPGSDEFGYTNFLFTVLEAPLLKLGLSGEAVAGLLSMPLSLAALLIAAAMVRRLTGSRAASMAAGLTIATHTSYSAYASGGLETSMQTFLVLSTYWLVWRYTERPAVSRAWWAGAVAAMAMLCRLDSVVLLAPALLWPWWSSWRARRQNDPTGRQERLAPLILTGLPVLATLLLLAGCHLYYGYALPNTFYAKAVGQESALGFGLYYVRTFLEAQAWFPMGLAVLTLIGLVAARRRPAHMEPLLLVAAGAVGLWLAYLLYVGGDFMEFRLLVPVIPLYVIIGYTVLRRLPHNIGAYAVPLVLILAVGANLYHRTAYDGFSGLIESTTALHDPMKRPHTSWVATGLALHGLFHTGRPGDVLIATRAAGAIPYFSDLPTVDQFGLNDRHVAMQGVPHAARPGHRRIASTEYLRARGVNLVIDHPTFVCDGEPDSPRLSGVPRLLIPVDSGECLLIAYYLTPHPRVDARLAEGAIRIAD